MQRNGCHSKLSNILTVLTKLHREELRHSKIQPILVLLGTMLEVMVTFLVLPPFLNISKNDFLGSFN